MGKLYGILVAIGYGLSVYEVISEKEKRFQTIKGPINMNGYDRYLVLAIEFIIDSMT